MAGAGISGKSGDVKIGTTQIAEIKGFSFNPKSNNPKYSSNKTGGYKRTVAGIKEGSGTMSGVFDPADMFITVIDVGTDVSLKLYLNATLFYLVPAVIDDYKINVDIDTGEYVSWEGTFSANGAWTNPVAAMMMPMMSQTTAQNVNPDLVAQAAEKMAANAITPELAELIRSIVKEAVKESIALQGLAEDGMLNTDGKTAEQIAESIVADKLAEKTATPEPEKPANIKSMSLQEATEMRLANGMDPTTAKPVPLTGD